MIHKINPTVKMIPLTTKTDRALVLTPKLSVIGLGLTMSALLHMAESQHATPHLVTSNPGILLMNFLKPSRPQLSVSILEHPMLCKRIERITGNWDPLIQLLVILVRIKTEPQELNELSSVPGVSQPRGINAV